LVNKFQLGPFEFAGGVTLAVLSAVVVLWPIIWKALQSGGNAEFLGIKLQLLEEKTGKLEFENRQEVAFEIAALRTDLEELRNLIQVSEDSDAIGASESSDNSHNFETAIEAYRKHRSFNDSKARTDVDRWLWNGAGRLPTQEVETRLDRYSDDQEVGMAAAVCLGLVYPGENDLQAVKLIARLLGSAFERVRFRAARSVEWRVQRSDTSLEARAILEEAMVKALNSEKAAPVMDALIRARSAVIRVGGGPRSLDPH